MKEVLSSIFFF